MHGKPDKTSKPEWLKEAELYLNTKPVPIPRRGWCAQFVRGCLELSGIPCPRFKKARRFLNFGSELPHPRLGCIVVFWRKAPTSRLGHVGFFLDHTKAGNLRILGGNQKDTVSIQVFPKHRVLGYRWPAKEFDVGNETRPTRRSQTT